MRLAFTAIASVGVLLSGVPAGCDESRGAHGTEEAKTNLTFVDTEGESASPREADSVGNVVTAEADDDGDRSENGAGEPVHLLDTASEPGAATPTDCSDGEDNDGDGLVDWQYDLGCYGPKDANEGGLATRELDHGWSVFEPSKDTRIIYVSSSIGNDANRGNSPSKPKKTIAAALDAVRNGHPDWVLLARGDIWTESLPVKEGRSRDEPFVVTTYGSRTERPLLKTGDKRGIESPAGKRFNNFAVVGIAFYAHTRDPNAPSYESGAGNSGINFFSKEGASGQGVLVEDCWFNFYKGNVIQGPGVNKDIVLRRNIITNNYNSDGHSSGMYSNNASIVLEENVFDHNGWYTQQVGKGNDKEDGQATIFNHNTYFVDQHGTTFRGNIFIRPSSIGTKWTANSGPGSTSDILIDDNLYIDGEVGISIGGNDKVAPYRFKNVIISNNVFLDMGRSRPTNRDLGWCIYIDDWDGGKVSRNLCIHQPSKDVKNVRAIQIEGVTRDVLLTNNVIHGLYTTKSLVLLSEGGTKQAIVFKGNQLQSQIFDSVLIEVRGGLENYRFLDDTYYSKRSTDEWFKLDRARGDLAMWRRASDATGSARKVAFRDPTRSIETYQRSLGREPSIDAFVSSAVAQSKYNWRAEYTAPAVNAWIRAGFIP